MNLVSMKLTPDEAKIEAAEGTAMAAPEDQPAYPCGLTIYLDDEVLAKLGMTALPDVGAPLMLTARRGLQQEPVREPGRHRHESVAADHRHGART
jgi:hypothetical protein